MIKKSLLEFLSLSLWGNSTLAFGKSHRERLAVWRLMLSVASELLTSLSVC